MGEVVLNEGGVSSLAQFVFRPVWTWQSHSDVEQNNVAEIGEKRWSQLDSIQSLERFVCSENTTDLATRTSCLDMIACQHGQYGLLPFCTTVFAHLSVFHPQFYKLFINFCVWCPTPAQMLRWYCKDRSAAVSFQGTCGNQHKWARRLWQPLWKLTSVLACVLDRSLGSSAY